MRSKITNEVECTTIGKLFDSVIGNRYCVGDGKFIESVGVKDYQVLTDTGWEDISAIHKTVEYEVWVVRTEGHSLECADDHLLFDVSMNTVYTKDLKVG